MAKDKAPKKEKAAKAPKKGRNNMASTRKDYDEVYAMALTESPQTGATVAKYFGILSKKMSELGWTPKPADAPVEETEVDTETED